MASPVRRFLNYIYLFLAAILLVALVAEFQRGPDITNVVLYGIALALAVALFEVRRRQFGAMKKATDTKATREGAPTAEQPQPPDA